MNTDNMTISGETIDYGPYAFMDRMIQILSLVQLMLMEDMLILISLTLLNGIQKIQDLFAFDSKDSKKAIELAEKCLKKFEENFKKSWLRMMKNKIGISKDDPSDEKLILELLS